MQYYYLTSISQPTICINNVIRAIIYCILPFVQNFELCVGAPYLRL